MYIPPSCTLACAPNPLVPGQQKPFGAAFKPSNQLSSPYCSCLLRFYKEWRSLHWHQTKAIPPAFGLSASAELLQTERLSPGPCTPGFHHELVFRKQPHECWHVAHFSDKEAAGLSYTSRVWLTLSSVGMAPGWSLSWSLLWASQLKM